LASLEAAADNCGVHDTSRGKCVTEHDRVAKQERIRVDAAAEQLDLRRVGYSELTQGRQSVTRASARLASGGGSGEVRVEQIFRIPLRFQTGSNLFGCEPAAQDLLPQLLQQRRVLQHRLRFGGCRLLLGGGFRSECKQRGNAAKRD
jgi:hypothetical protein